MPHSNVRLRIMALLTAILIALAVPTLPAAAADMGAMSYDITLDLDGRQPMNMYKPLIAGGRTFVTTDLIANDLNTDVVYDADTMTVKVVKSMGMTDMMAQAIMLDEAAMVSITVDGAGIMGDAHPLVQDGVLYLPLRQVAEALGYTVGWDGETRTVTVEMQ